METQQFVLFNAGESFFRRQQFKKKLVLHVKYAIFLSDFNKSMISSTDFHKCAQYQVPSSDRLGDTYAATYRRDEVNGRFSRFNLLSLLVTWCTTSLTFNNCTLCPHCIYVFCFYLRTNSDLCHLQHKLIGFYNRDEKCLQRGTDWVFKYSGLRFVCKDLNTFSTRCSKWEHNKQGVHETAVPLLHLALASAPRRTANFAKQTPGISKMRPRQEYRIQMPN